MFQSFKTLESKENMFAQLILSSCILASKSENLPRDFVDYCLAAKDQMETDDVEVEFIIKYKGVVVNRQSIKDDEFLESKRKEIADYYALSLGVDNNVDDV